MRRLGKLVALFFLTIITFASAQEPLRVSVSTLRTCVAHTYHIDGAPDHPLGDKPFDVSVITPPLGMIVEVRGCEGNRDFHFARNIGDTEGVEFYAIPMLNAGDDDFLIRIGDSETSRYFVHSAQVGYAEIFTVELWGEDRLEDVDSDGKFELMLQKISEFTCANGYRTNLVYDSEEFQTIDADTVCGR